MRAYGLAAEEEDACDAANVSSSQFAITTKRGRQMYGVPSDAPKDETASKAAQEKSDQNTIANGKGLD